jgi:hypothetical protein
MVEAVRSSPVRVSVPPEPRSRGLSSPVNGQVGGEQTALARFANSLLGAFVWGSGAPQIRSAALGMTKERATFDKDWLLNRGALKPNLDGLEVQPSLQGLKAHSSPG